MSRLAPVLGLLLIATAVCGQNPGTVGTNAPSFRARALAPDSGIRSLAQYRGQVVLLVFWATWCEECRRVELPSLERLQHTYGAQGLRVVTINVEPALRDPAIQRFLQAEDFTFEVLRDAGGHLMGRYGALGVPSTFLIDRHGVIRRHNFGPAPWDEGSLFVDLKAALGAA